MRRRDCLLWVGSAALPFTAVGSTGVDFAAAWARGRQQQVGVLRVRDGAAVAIAAIDVPTRAHGLLREPGGSLLAVARRPGDWLLRWRPDGRSDRRIWSEPQRSFNGHLLTSRDGRRLFCTETDTDTGRSLIGVRDAASLEKIAEWPTHGIDAHQMLLDDDGHLMVANGGVPAQAETGRMKPDSAAMDASLVRLDGASGEWRGRWRLADSRLSPRHLAWSERDATGRRRLGVALQSEHDAAAVRDAAPVLALFDGERFTACALPDGVTLAGYGGDIAWQAGQWIVSCPRADGLAWWQADGRWIARSAAAGACALAACGDALWSGGRRVEAWRDAGSHDDSAWSDHSLRLDNHWLRV